MLRVRSHALGVGHLLDKKGSKDSRLRGFSPVVYWEMTSRSAADAAFPLHDNICPGSNGAYCHGGNGALFFGG